MRLGRAVASVACPPAAPTLHALRALVGDLQQHLPVLKAHLLRAGGDYPLVTAASPHSARQQLKRVLAGIRGEGA